MIAYHPIHVQSLKILLAMAMLKDDDVLVPNEVGNLAIFRNEVQIGYVDLHAKRVELYAQPPEGAVAFGSRGYVDAGGKVVK
jgi:hypothetical protein